MLDHGKQIQNKMSDVEWVLGIEEWCEQTKDLLQKEEDFTKKLLNVQEEISNMKLLLAEKQTEEEQLKTDLNETEVLIKDCKAKFQGFGEAIC